ncbi:MAG: hypothetical protein ACR2NL_06155 [Acidimicrobiia bacterium]
MKQLIQDSAAVAWVTRQNTGVEIIGVPNIDDGDEEDRAKFMLNMSTRISHVLDDPDEFWIAHGVTGNPAMVFVAADGTTEQHHGAVGPQELLERVEALAAAA